MRIGVDIAPLRPPYTGVSNYEFYLLDALMTAGTEEYVGFELGHWLPLDVDRLRARGLADGKNLIRQGGPAPVAQDEPPRAQVPPPEPEPVPAAEPAGRRFRPGRWLVRSLRDRPMLHALAARVRSLHFAGTLHRQRIDLFHAFVYRAPGPSTVPVLPVVYDLSHERHPDTHPVARINWMRPLARELPRAPMIHTISHFTAREITQVYGVPAERIAVAYPGVSPVYREPPKDAAATLRRLGLGAGGFCLTVSTLEPRKNLATLVAAFARLDPAERRAMPLCVVGAKGWGDLALPSGAAELERDGSLRFLGYVTEPELRDLYATTRLMLYPSLYEGFGMPVTEALACGAPVATSDAASMPEAAGAVGRLVQPLDVDGWTAELRRALDGAAHDDAAERRRRQAHAARFTWEAAAAATRAMYRGLASR